MIRENLRMGVSSIRRNPLRSTLSTLGVAIGIASVVAVASVADGLTQTVTAEFGDVGGGYIAVFWSAPRDDIVRRRAFLSLADGEAAFRESPAVDAFDPVLSFRPEVRLYDEAMGLNANGVGPMHLEVAGKTLARGRFLTEEDMQRQTRAAVVGAEVWSELARELGGGFGGTNNPIGERLLVDGVLFTIVGVLEAKERGVLSSGDPNQMLLIPVTTAQYRFGAGPGHPAAARLPRPLARGGRAGRGADPRGSPAGPRPAGQCRGRLPDPLARRAPEFVPRHPVRRGGGGHRARRDHPSRRRSRRDECDAGRGSRTGAGDRHP